MDKDYLLGVIQAYFEGLRAKGYSTSTLSEKVLILAFIEELLNTDFFIYIEEEDCSIISEYLSNLYGEECIIPYPIQKKIMAKDTHNRVLISSSSHLRITQDNSLRSSNSNLLRTSN